MPVMAPKQACSAHLNEHRSQRVLRLVVAKPLPSSAGGDVDVDPEPPFALVST